MKSARTLHTPAQRLASASNRMALVLCSDKNLHWQSAFALLRHAKQDRGGAVDLYYYTTDALSQGLDRLLRPRVTIRYWNEGLTEAGYRRPEHVTEATLLRIFALDELALTYDTVVYTDSDVFLRWGSFADLGQLNLGDAPIAAVRDRTLWGAPASGWLSRRYFANLPPGTHGRYFNAGVLVANSDVWLSRKTSTAALEFLKSFPQVCHYGDQSALNAAVNGDWAELSPSWNWQADFRYDHLIPTRNPRLVHFTGPAKPWKDRMLRFDEYYFQMMREFLMETGLEEELGVVSRTRFDASKERLRTKVLAESKPRDFLGLRDIVKPYIDRSDFVDVLQGVASYGWRKDPMVATAPGP